MTVRAFALPPLALALAAMAPAQPAPAYDPQDPASLIALLAGMDAKAEVAGKSQDGVMLKVTTPSFTFGAQFAGCDAQGRKCKALAFTTLSTAFRPTLAQLNGYNQTSLTCRVWQDKAGQPNVMYSTLISPGGSPDDAHMHIAAWQGCLQSFGEFLKDPAGYLASAP